MQFYRVLKVNSAKESETLYCTSYHSHWIIFISTPDLVFDPSNCFLQDMFPNSPGHVYLASGPGICLTSFT